MSTSLKVLVTGATGFLGGAVCAELRAAGGWKVTATGRDLAKGAGIAADRFQPADLTEPGAAAALLRGQEAVVHCAALASPWGRGAEFERANVGVTRALLDAAVAAGVRRFVHVSTPAIYAEFAHREGLTENSPLPPRPINDYARTKLAGERLVLAAADRLEVVVLRPHALLGVGDAVLLPRLVRAAARGRLPMIGDGRARTDLCAVENAALACRLALEAGADRVAGTAFNVANDEPVLLWDTLREFLRAAGLPGPRGRVPFPVAWAGAALAEGWSRAVSGREPAMTRYGAAVLAFSHTFDLAKARQRLGYAPRVSLAESLERTARWWRVPLQGETQTMTPPNLRVHLWAIGACRGPGGIAAQGTAWRSRRFPALAAALCHPIHGWTLFDTGYDGRYFDVTRAWPHRLHRWVLPVTLPAEERLEWQMAAAGLRPGDVRRVIVSHFHLDHIAGLHRFPDAEIVFAAAAWDAVRGLTGWRAARAVFHPDLANGDQLENRGRALRAADAVPWEGFAETWDLFGDDSLRLVALPGHAPGQLGAVFRRAPDGRPVFLVADALWTRENLRGHPPHRLANFLMHDRPAFDDTLERLRRFAAAHPDALLVPSHCAATLAAWPSENGSPRPA